MIDMAGLNWRRSSKAKAGTDTARAAPRNRDCVRIKSSSLLRREKRKNVLCGESDQCGRGARAGNPCAYRGQGGRVVERLGKERGAGQRQRQVANELNTVAVDPKGTVMVGGQMAGADRFLDMARCVPRQQRLRADPQQGQ